ncbi:hypothetical protein ET495_04175 [Xylanimonas allomyrinae]|uniref:Uncharacterized protein n=1 Tax=Xylanimonas allomyrinae TaxID=2509459 RepID=A0A4P6EX39_9MICO|nr:hypothetical protein [Xylanimonas allomyrinae]QAY62578.1 hypothetical protein ET495_04175 [Xylanimonas allomyrinae]
MVDSAPPPVPHIVADGPALAAPNAVDTWDLAPRTPSARRTRGPTAARHGTARHGTARHATV